MSDVTSGSGGLSRGEFLKRSGVAVGGAVVGGGLAAEKAWARPIDHGARDASVETLTIGYVSPLTGPDAGFGEPDPYVISLAQKQFNKGFKVAGKSYKVKIISKDAQSTPSVAAQVAQELINGDGVDLLLTTSTPEVVVPVSTAAEAAGVPAISTTVPWQSWWLGSGNSLSSPKAYQWIYHFCFGVGNFFDTYTDLWKQVPTNKTVGVMYPNDDDGNAIRGALAPLLEQAGYTIIDPGAYEDGTTDFTSQITLFKQKNCQIFNTFPIPSDFTTFWRQAAQQGYTSMVKIAQIAKTGLFVSQIEAVGLKLGNRLATGAYWGPTWPGGSTFTGISNKELGAGYEKHSGKYWNQQTGASMALFDVAAAALKASGNPKDKSAVANALKTLQVKTTLGELHWGTGNSKTNPVPNVVQTPIPGGQWLTTKKGSKYPLEFLFCEHED
ncbi:MAG TPA: ABC transporter substrate-binding protein, partial [Solirubrobacteraceae bacterium]|nr:ABC transporter substrate-binding protein [Solirubrobacteraceae bacterium]